MLMDLGMKSTANCGYMHYTIAVSLEMSDEPPFFTNVWRTKKRPTISDWTLSCGERGIRTTNFHSANLLIFNMAFVVETTFFAVLRPLRVHGHVIVTDWLAKVCLINYTFLTLYFWAEANFTAFKIGLFSSVNYFQHACFFGCILAIQCWLV